MKKILLIVMSIAIFNNFAFAGFYQDKLDKKSTAKFNKQTIENNGFEIIDYSYDFDLSGGKQDGIVKGQIKFYRDYDKFNISFKAVEVGKTKIRCLAVSELTDIKSGDIVDFEAIGRLDDEMLPYMKRYQLSGFFVNDYTGKTE